MGIERLGSGTIEEVGIWERVLKWKWKRLGTTK